MEPLGQKTSKFNPDIGNVQDDRTFIEHCIIKSTHI